MAFGKSASDKSRDQNASNKSRDKSRDQSVNDKSNNRSAGDKKEITRDTDCNLQLQPVNEARSLYHRSCLTDYLTYAEFLTYPPSF